jgi:hypothetical protein
MKRQVFDSLDHDALGWACIEPAILQIRGKDLTVKSEVYAQLNTGQRALLMFRVLYDHARNSVTEFYCWVAYLLEQPKTWAEIRIGLRYFGDDAMLRLLENMKGVLEANQHVGAEMRDVSFKDLEDDLELLASVSRLYALFQEIAPETLKRISAHIRNNPGEFVQIED